MQWVIIGILDGNFVAPDGREFENAQVIAQVSTQTGETPWQALARQGQRDSYVAELLLHRSKGNWESLIAYELIGTRLEPSESDEGILESLIRDAHP